MWDKEVNVDGEDCCTRARLLLSGELLAPGVCLDDVVAVVVVVVSVTIARTLSAEILSSGKVALPTN